VIPLAGMQGLRDPSGRGILCDDGRFCGSGPGDPIPGRRPGGPGRHGPCSGYPQEGRVDVPGW